jgi:hypothetical protein
VGLIEENPFGPDQENEIPPEADRVRPFPTQVGPELEERITGRGFTTTEMAVDVSTQPFASVPITK